MLSPEQATQLASFSSSSPTPDDVVQFTEQITKGMKTRKSNIFAERVQGLLYSIQQYSSIVDVCASSNLTAALVWGSAKILLLVKFLPIAPFSPININNNY
jgi:hypothetical protein